MSEVALDTLSNFRATSPESNVSPSEPIFVTPSQLKDLINQAVAEATEPILQDLQELRQEVQNIKDAKPGITALRIDDAFEAIEQIDEHLARIDRTRTTVSPQGFKTIARITKLKEILRARRAGITFQEAERLLGIKPNQMTRLVSQLDKRSFEIFARAGKNRQKIIRLKAQI